MERRRVINPQLSLQGLAELERIARSGTIPSEEGPLVYPDHDITEDPDQLRFPFLDL